MFVSEPPDALTESDRYDPTHWTAFEIPEVVDPAASAGWYDDATTLRGGRTTAGSGRSPEPR